MTIDDIIDAKVGTTQVMAMYMGNEKVWPRNFVVTYVIDTSSISIEYSEGTKLYANGSNYAAFYANILEYHNGVYDHTNTHQRLIVSLPASSIFYIENNTVKGYNLGANGYGERNAVVYVAYDTLEPVQGGYVGQEANVPTVDYNTYNDVAGTPYVDGYTDSDYFVSISSNRYTSTSTAAPASGTTSATRAYLTVVAYHNQTEIIRTPWTRYATPHYTWTSGATSVGDPVVDRRWSEQSSGATERVTDTATITGGGSGFTLSGNYVSVASEGTTEYTSGRNTYFYATNGTASDSVRLFQARNVITETVPTSETQWGTPVVTTTDHSYVVTFDVSQYKTSANPAPASGGYAMLILGGSHTRTTETATPWSTVSYNTYVWSSGAESYSTPSVIDSGTDRDYVDEAIVDTPTVAFSGSHDGFTLESDRVTMDNRGTSAGAARSATLVATNGEASASVTVYQERNRVESTSYAYDRAIAIQHEGDLPSTASTYSVTYTSYRTPTYTYTSGATETGTRDAYAATIAGTNCTPSANSVSGTGAITIDVTANTSTTQTRTVSVSLTSGGTTVSDSRTQEVYVPTSQNVATFKPFMFPYNAGPYLKGKVYYQFLIVSGTLTSGTLTGVNFRYQVNGGAKQTIQVGTFEASEHTDPTAFEPQGITIPTFSSGTIKCWFEVTGSKGGFDVINADDVNPDYYSEVTL